VLNAFRHQRNDHLSKRDFDQAIDGCSTPSGIKGTITAKARFSLKDRNSVLNAFRHQRNDHVRRKH